MYTFKSSSSITSTLYLICRIRYYLKKILCLWKRVKVRLYVMIVDYVTFSVSVSSTGSARMKLQVGAGLTELLCGLPSRTACGTSIWHECRNITFTNVLQNVPHTHLCKALSRTELVYGQYGVTVQHRESARLWTANKIILERYRRLCHLPYFRHRVFAVS